MPSAPGPHEFIVAIGDDREQQQDEKLGPGERGGAEEVMQPGVWMTAAVETSSKTMPPSRSGLLRSPTVNREERSERAANAFPI